MVSTERHVVIVGLMASGKTTVSKVLAEELGRPFRDCDEMLEARTGRTAAAIAAVDGSDALHEIEADVLLDALRAPTASVITAAASTIEHAGCRDALADVFVIWLRAEVDDLVQRVRAQPHRPLDDDVAAQLTAQAARRDPLFGAVADVIVDV